ncbi:hypothetical protein RvY_07361 [Ramazzottius varieornatus]|uniref:WAP domain-containing protein n=1 Tax=Ramazzottius varieornatus TaxID=947166 RepID=A0A1D1V804_RAMVA|nr:hypothetical protein RvY_07361 [Ramazzottius varieornatus]
MQRGTKNALLVSLVLCLYLAFSDAKKGRCPSTAGMIGTCDERCRGDNSCPGVQKCCSNGCGHSCQNPVRSSRLAKRGSMGICVEKCDGDDSCPTDRPHCRSNGCGHTCEA